MSNWVKCRGINNHPLCAQCHHKEHVHEEREVCETYCIFECKRVRCTPVDISEHTTDLWGGGNDGVGKV